MNTNLHAAAEQWVGLINGELACHTGAIQFPMRKGWKRIHRLVVLPDYQGIGIGTNFLNAVCEHYNSNGWEVNLTTTTPALVHALRRSGSWILKRYGRVKGSLQKSMNERYGVKVGTDKNKSDKRITYSFNYNKD